jgi:hypothetical protein
MKKIIILFFLFTYQNSFGQKKDSIIAPVEFKEDMRPLGALIIINGFLFDSLTANLIVDKFKDKLYSRKWFSSKDCYNKWGLTSKNGVEFFIMKNDFVLNFDKMKLWTK